MNAQALIESWKNAGIEVLRVAFAGEFTKEALAVVSAGVLTFLVVVVVVGKAQGLPRATWGRVLAATLAGLLVVWLAETAAWLYVLPRFAALQHHRKLVLEIVAVVVAFAIVLPVLCFALKASYLQGFINFALGAAAAAVAVVLMGSFMDSARQEQGQFNKIRARTSDMDDFMNRQK